MKTEADLLTAAHTLEGLSFLQLATLLNRDIPHHQVTRKGWAGQAIERYLGVTDSSKVGPDFESLGIELKTLPLRAPHKPAESTFITTISPLTLHQETWQTSACWAKLKRILWIPVEGDRQIPFLERRIGRAWLWSPSPEEARILESDWQELTALMVLGHWDALHASLGEYLQVRPKAADGKALRYAYDEAGECAPTLPRGFYLRARFTESICRLGQGQTYGNTH